MARPRIKHPSDILKHQPSDVDISIIRCTTAMAIFISANINKLKNIHIGTLLSPRCIHNSQLGKTIIVEPACHPQVEISWYRMLLKINQHA